MALKRHRLCQRRKALGFSQERLAELLGVERSTVVRWESAETDPQPWHRSRIASALRVTLEQLDEMLVDVSVAACRGQVMGNDSQVPSSGAARTELLTGLRTFLTSYLPAQPTEPVRSLVEVRRSVGRVHSLYQRASYTSAARLLPDVLGQATQLANPAPNVRRAAAFRLLAAAYIAASKLAAKVGDGHMTLLAADRASTAAGLAGDRPLAAVAAYQAACGLLRLPGRTDEAEQVVQASIEGLMSGVGKADPDLISAHGALLLLAAVVAAGRGDPKAVGWYLSEADDLVTQLGSDRNRLWTGFGPTNVAIHAVSAAVRAGNADRAVEVGARLDTSRLPTMLIGRRAQVHVDLAAATMMGSADRSAAVLHLLEAERVAAESVHTNIQARSLLLDLLSKERRAATPGLRPLAERAGLLV
ncbi:helix-turn-helix transcriptional regulator [Micromonospora sp. CPCC 205711]|uniref:helix-turn-helix transcriptional regulator n=1 Tax=Micromonospora sp. CPCC 205547 TaxID=3122400 RepID=UPI002FF1B242